AQSYNGRSSIQNRGACRRSSVRRRNSCLRGSSPSWSPMRRLLRGLLPGQRFVPLAEVVAERSLIRRQSGAAFRVFAGHRKGWLHVLDDGAGDGYFYDPERTDAQGAFFFHFAEINHYVWFPSLRNFLSGVIECYQTQAVKVAVDGKGLD